MATTDSSHASTNLDGVPADLAIETETIGPGKMATNSAQVATEVVGDDAVGRLAASIAGTSDSSIEGPIVLILCGLIASGKSTFAESLQAHFPRFRRCNQDDLGDRRQVEYLARQSLAQGHSVCIDRTNFNASQRFYWIKIAREFPGTPVWVIVFDTPYEVCAARLQHRTGHPTITSPELGLSVLSRFASDFEPPQAHEGYDRILYLKPSDHPEPEYRLADISAILQRVRDSPPVTPPPTGGLGQPNASPSSRGFPGRHYNTSPSNRGWGGQGQGQSRGQGYSPRGGSYWRGGYSGPTYGNNQREAGSPGSGYSYSDRGRGYGGRGHSAGAWRSPGAPGFGNRGGGQQPLARGGYANAGFSTSQRPRNDLPLGATCGDSGGGGHSYPEQGGQGVGGGEGTHSGVRDDDRRQGGEQTGSAESEVSGGST